MGSKRPSGRRTANNPDELAAVASSSVLEFRRRR
jgi:hypothetical protein